MRHRLPQFNHLFTSDAYSAGYYSYLWSDVMASDAWAAFVEAGSPWDRGCRRQVPGASSWPVATASTGPRRTAASAGVSPTSMRC